MATNATRVAFHSINSKVIVLSGPPKSGKTSIENLILPALNFGGFNAVRLDPVEPLREYLNEISPDCVEESVYQACKDLECLVDPTTAARTTPRLLMIHHWERVCFLRGDPLWLIKEWHKRVRELEAPNLVILCTVGRQSEFDYIKTNMKRHADLLLFRIHRRDCTFKGDSRHYLDYNVSGIDITNVNALLDETAEAILDAIKEAWPTASP